MTSLTQARKLNNEFVLYLSSPIRAWRANSTAPVYETCKREGPWFNMYLLRAIGEYTRALKIELPKGTLDKLKKLIECEMDLKRQGYYFAIGFLDETCNLCKKCTRPFTCDKPEARPSWKMLPMNLQRKYDLKDGDGIIFVE